VFTDIFFYTIAIPVVPFRLEALGYKNPSSLTGWLLFAFSGGLVFSTPPIAFVSMFQPYPLFAHAPTDGSRKESPLAKCLF